MTTIRAIDVASLLGEVHHLIVLVCTSSKDKWLTYAQVFDRTCLDGVELHHAMAEMLALKICTVSGGAIRFVEHVPKDVADFFDT